MYRGAGYREIGNYNGNPFALVLRREGALPSRAPMTIPGRRLRTGAHAAV